MRGYPLPDIRLLPRNGSYSNMDSRTISRIHNRCYGHKLSIRQWGWYDEGIFFSRFDKYPYWCRDMLAYRAALSSCSPKIGRINKIRAFLIQFVRNVEKFIDDSTRKIHDVVYRQFLDDDDFPVEMRHLWDVNYVPFHHGR